MRKVISNRRRFLGQLGAGGSLLTLGDCDTFDGWLGTGNPLSDFLRKANVLTRVAQRAIQGPATLAREYPQSAIREGQRPNGSTYPQTADYLAVKQKISPATGCKSHDTVPRVVVPLPPRGAHHTPS
jgi:hypothetical protein